MKIFYSAAAWFLFCSAVCPSPSFAGELFSWEKAVSETQKNNPDLVSAKESISQSQADRAIAQSSFFPQVQGEADARRSKSAGSSLKTSSYSYGVSGSQLIFDGFKTYFEVEQAVQNVDASRYRYEATSSDVRLDLRVAFVNLLRAQESIRITEKIADRRKQSRDLISLRYEAGREHRGSLLTAEANWSQAVFEVRQAHRNLAAAQRRLLTRMGRNHFSPVQADGSLEAVSFETEKPDLEHLAETTPLLRQLIVLKEAARWGVRSSQADFFPKIYANASAGRSASSWPPDRSEWGIGASLSVPLFEGGNRVASLSKASSFFRQAQAEEESGRNGVLLTLEETWTDFQDAVEQVAVQKKFLEAGLERSKIAEAEYSNGLISFNDWIIIEDNLVRAEKSYLDAQANALIAEANWRQAKGEILQ